MTKSVRTALLLLAAALHLQAAGWLPPFAKVGGDILLLMLVVQSVLAVRRSGTKSELDTGRTTWIAKTAVCFFGVYVLALVLYSICLWGEPLLVLRWARRWMVAWAYYYLAISLFPTQLSLRMMRWWLMCACAVIALSVLLVRGYVELPGLRQSAAENFQGNILLLKVFVPGSLLLFVTAFFHLERMKGRLWWHAILFAIAQVVFVSLFVPFRGWALSCLAAIGFALFLFGCKECRFLSFGIAGTAMVCLASWLPATEFSSTFVPWLASCWEDLENISGSIAYRFDMDVSRLLIIWERESVLYNWFGIGFVAKGSYGESMFGFTSETNDSGWIEVLLTGGYVGAAIISLMMIAMMVWLLRQYAKYGVSMLPAICTLLVGCLLMGTSCTLLYDFGIVPISFVILYSRLGTSARRQI